MTVTVTEAADADAKILYETLITHTIFENDLNSTPSLYLIELSLQIVVGAFFSLFRFTFAFHGFQILWLETISKSVNYRLCAFLFAPQNTIVGVIIIFIFLIIFYILCICFC